MADALKSTTQAGTLILTLSNPALKNAMGPDTYAAGIEALSAAENSADIRSVVITGEARQFCAGESLQRLHTSRRDTAEVQAQCLEGLHNWIDTIRTYPKPVIAAVEGSAEGAGFALALACDFIVAADNATFAMNQMQFGLSAHGGGSWAVARALPRALASELLMGGEPIQAQRLLTLGLINRISAAGHVLDEALRLAATLNALAPNAVASTKELISDAASHSLNQQHNIERDHIVRNLRHANGGEGLNAFLKDRTPHYR